MKVSDGTPNQKACVDENTVHYREDGQRNSTEKEKKWNQPKHLVSSLGNNKQQRREAEQGGRSDQLGGCLSTFCFSETFLLKMFLGFNFFVLRSDQTTFFVDDNITEKSAFKRVLFGVLENQTMPFFLTRQQKKSTINRF